MKSRRIFLELTIVVFAVFILLWIFVPKFLAVQIVNIPGLIPDANLRESVSLTLGVGRDGPLTRTKAKEYAGELRVGGCENLKGLEFFPNLVELNITSKTLEAFDFSMLPNLEVLNLNASKLESLDLSNNSKIKDLYISVDPNNPIPNHDIQFDLSNNANLQSLSLYSTGVQEIDLSHCPGLSRLVIVNLLQVNQGQTGLKTLDLSHSNKLKTLNINNNQLSEIDVSMLKELKELSCSNNQLTRLDISKNLKITELVLYDNPLQEVIYPKKWTYQQYRLDMDHLDRDSVLQMKRTTVKYNWFSIN